jgi:membrane-associated protein
MTDALMQWLHDAMASPWVYPALLLLAWLDGFLPAFPSESAVITGGVFAASGVTDWRLVVLVSAVGAFLGDHTSYALGRWFRGPAMRRSGPDTKRGAALRRWRGVLDQRGGLVIVVARYVPGGRTAVTVSAGMVGYPVRRFTPFAGLAAVSWAVYGTAVGYVGGAAFEDDPIKGVVLGIGLALGVTAIVEIVRHRLARRRAARSTGEVSSAEAATLDGHGAQVAAMPSVGWDDDAVSAGRGKG